jgi:hypothetical protein
MLKTKKPPVAVAGRPAQRRPQFAQSELWESLEGPVQVADAIRTLAALRRRFEQALDLGHESPRQAGRA